MLRHEANKDLPPHVYRHHKKFRAVWTAGGFTFKSPTFDTPEKAERWRRNHRRRTNRDPTARLACRILRDVLASCNPDRTLRNRIMVYLEEYEI